MSVYHAFGHNVPYMSGNRLGVDHFNFPVLDPTDWAELLTEASAADDRRIGLEAGTGCTMAGLMSLVWRVKSWKVTGPFAITYDTAGPGGIPRAFSGTLGPPGDPEATDQYDGFLVRAIVRHPPDALESDSVLANEEGRLVTFINSRSYAAENELLPDIYVPWNIEYYEIFQKYPDYMSNKFRYQVTNFRHLSSYWGPNEPTSPGYDFYGPGTSVIDVAWVDGVGSGSDGCIVTAGTSAGEVGIGGLGDANNTYGTQHFVVYDSETELFYPQIGCNVSFDQAVTGFDATIRAAEVADTPNGTLTIAPGIAPSWQEPVVIEADDSSGGSVDFLMEPHEFWPFVNRAGDPVYYTETGDILNDPFG